MAIKTFKCAETEDMFKRIRIKRFVNIEAAARRKLEQLEWAVALDDLRVPPGNRLEALKGDRAGQQASASTISSGCASYGRKRAQKMSKLWTITDGA